MLLNLLGRTGQPPTTEDCLAPNVSNPKAERPRLGLGQGCGAPPSVFFSLSVSLG